jgi:hypothetical protein
VAIFGPHANTFMNPARRARQMPRAKEGFEWGIKTDTG